MESGLYKSCFIPICKASTINTPKKKFIRVPTNEEVIKVWNEYIGQSTKKLPKRFVFCCEDHYYSIFGYKSPLNDKNKWKEINSELKNQPLVQVILDKSIVDEYSKAKKKLEEACIDLKTVDQVDCSRKMLQEIYLKILKNKEQNLYKTNIEPLLNDAFENFDTTEKDVPNDKLVENELINFHYDIVENGEDYKEQEIKNDENQEKNFSVDKDMTEMKMINGSDNNNDFTCKSNAEDFYSTIEIDPEKKLPLNTELLEIHGDSDLASNPTLLMSGGSNSLVYLYCDKCDYKASNKSSLLQHIRDSHSEKSENEENNSFVCSKCGKKFKHCSRLRNHELSCGINWLKCSLCWRKYKTPLKLKEHYSILHPNAIDSEKLNEIFDNIPNRDNESIDKINNTVLALAKRPKIKHFAGECIRSYCAKCRRSFERIQEKCSYKINCPTCNTKLNHQCKKCNKLFVKYRAIIQHVRLICYPKNYFKCSKCDFTTIRKQNIIAHEQVRHSKDGEIMTIRKLGGSTHLYKCDNCDFQTYYKYNFKIHTLLQHTTDSCQVEETVMDFTKNIGKINKSKNSKHTSLFTIFTSNGSSLNASLLKSEILTPKIRMLDCNECNYRIKNKSILRRHLMNEHTELYDNEKKLFFCERRKCYKTFKLQEVYELHKALCPIRFNCLYCPGKYIKNSYIKKHMITAHPEFVKVSNINDIYIEISNDRKIRRAQARADFEKRIAINYE